MDSQELHQKLSKSVKQLMWVLATLALTLVIAVILYFNREGLNQKLNGENTEATDSVQTEKKETGFWQAVDLNLIKDPAQKELVWYGKELISHTSKYLGPKGSVTQISNGMNCQNCHLDAGTKVFGNNYGSVAANYPKFRARSGAEEDIYKRVNDCFERSLNGKALDTLSKEMQAIKAYITYIGSNTEKGKKAEGSGFKELTFLDRAADPKKGKEVYTAKCQSCHQSNGQGLLNAEGTEYSFPPLWGKHAYNDKAGLYRITFFARYAKNNMP
jgi:thiosulfate dehydrogenase